ncbi:MAG: hypothetical protein JW778_07840 [Candidatus Altiarchaeota archaeon]|nr:hypothetical protein [Candidatus Altiarchaeota archaeon]
MGKTTTYGIIVLFLFAVGACAVSAYDATNVVVDFDKTEADESLLAGESGVLNLVIKNTGDYDAEDVEVWIQSNAKITSSKRLYVGVIEGGESKTLLLTLKVNDDAATGLAVIPVEISYDGYDKYERRKYDQHTSWQIPLRIEGDPLFQVKPAKTTFYRDNVDELILQVKTENSVRNLQATLTSECLTIIGSSRAYIGDINTGKEFNITYDIKPTEEGACTADLTLSYSDSFGSKTSDEINIGLNIEEAGVDFRITNISYDATGPGQTMKLRLSVKNVGEADAKDTTLSLSLSDPFTTADTTEKYVGRVNAGETVDAEFNLAVSWDAETKVYSVPLNIGYKVGGTSYTAKKDVGVDVGGQVRLEIINVESSRGSLQVDVANVGTRTAESIKATLVVGDGARFVSSSTASQTTRQTGGGLGIIPGMGRSRPTTSGDTGNTDQTPQAMEATNTSGQPQTYVAYKSDIKPTKQTTFTFDASISGTATLVFEYTGANNERITQREQISLGGTNSMTGVTGFTAATGSRGSTGITTYLIYGVAVLVVVFVAYKLYRKRKNK